MPTSASRSGRFPTHLLRFCSRSFQEISGIEKKKKTNQVGLISGGDITCFCRGAAGSSLPAVPRDWVIPALPPAGEAAAERWISPRHPRCVISQIKGLGFILETAALFSQLKAVPKPVHLCVLWALPRPRLSLRHPLFESALSSCAGEPEGCQFPS